jgi:hypothetical protein
MGQGTLRVIAALTAATSALCACSEGDTGSPGHSVATQSPATGVRPHLLTHPNGGFKNAALVDGVLTIGPADCVGVRFPGMHAPPGVDKVFALVVPDGSSVARDGRSIHIPGAGDFAFGERLTLGGGFAEFERRSQAPADWRSCANTQVDYAVVHAS